MVCVKQRHDLFGREGHRLDRRNLGATLVVHIEHRRKSRQRAEVRPRHKGLRQPVRRRRRLHIRECLRDLRMPSGQSHLLLACFKLVHALDNGLESREEGRLLGSH